MLLIEICNGLSAGQTYRLFPGSHVIGRSRSADFRLQDGCVSGKHTRLTVSSDGVVLENLSARGTSMEDSPVLEPTTIEAGKRFRMQEIEVLLRPPTMDHPPADPPEHPRGFFNQMPEDGSADPENDEATATRTQAVSESTPLGFFAEILDTKEQPEPVGAEWRECETETPTRAPTGWAAETPFLATPQDLLEVVTMAPPMDAEPTPVEPAIPAKPEKTEKPEQPEQATFAAPSMVPPAPQETPPIAQQPWNQSKTPAGFPFQQADEATAEPWTDEPTMAQATEIVSDTDADVEKTVKADPELINRLRELEHKKAKRRLLLAGLFLAMFGVLLYLGPPRGAPPELTLSWPKKADGSYSEGGIKLPLGGGRVVFPHPPGGKAQIDSFEGGFTIETHVGRALDVPLYLHLEDRADTDLARRHLPRLVTQWQNEKRQTELRYSFSPALQKPFFIGRQNAVPATIVPYQYQNGELRSGFAWFVHLGDRLLVLRSEIASKDFDRGKGLVGTNFLSFDAATIRRYWLPQPDAGSATRQELLADATQNLGRIAPGTWSATERALMHVIADATAEVAFADISRGFELLERLRTKQDLWFRNLKLERDAAYISYNDKEIVNIRRRAMSIFTNPSDKRYHTIRDW